jgi:hypothetical protein
MQQLHGPPRRPPLIRATHARYTLADQHTARVFLTAGTTESSDALSSFRLGSALPFRSEFPLILHGYFVEEVFARRFWLLNLAYRFPLPPVPDRVRLQLSFDRAHVDYAPGHRLPRNDLRGVGGQEAHALLEYKF